MTKQYKIDEATFLKLIEIANALMLQQFNDKEVIDNIASALGDVVLDIMRLTNEEKSDTL